MNLVKGGKTSVDHAMGRPFKVPTPPKVRNLPTGNYLLLIYSKLCNRQAPPPLSFSCCGSSSHSKISTPLPFSFFQLLSSLSHFLFPCCVPVTVWLGMLFGPWIVICPVVLHLQFFISLLFCYSEDTSQQFFVISFVHFPSFNVQQLPMFSKLNNSSCLMRRENKNSTM